MWGRSVTAALLVFAAGVATVIYGTSSYDDAYGLVAHTSDVRVAIGRAVGHTGRGLQCQSLRYDVDELLRLTTDNEVQQVRIASFAVTLERACASFDAQLLAELLDQLGELDQTEVALMAARRHRLSETRAWTLAAFVITAIAAIAAVALALRALTRSEERFRLLANTSRDLIRIHDVEGRPTYVSPSVEELLGYTTAEMLAFPALELGHPDDLDRMRATLDDIRRDHAPASTLVYRLRAKDGSYRWFETHTDPIRDRHGKLLRFYTTARDVTERVELQRDLEAAAITDELTGLLNRRGFLLLAQQQHLVAKRQKVGLAVIFADLDGLKTINDKHGHEHGDRAIRDLAMILRTTLRQSDIVARLGGDEFAMLAYEVDRAKVDVLLERVRTRVAAAPSIGEYTLAVSLGVALLEPGANRNLDELIADADQRMYEIKRVAKAELAMNDAITTPLERVR